MKLIDADAFIEDLKAEATNLYLNGMKGTPQNYKELYDIIDRIGEQPTVSPAEVVQGQWVSVDERLPEGAGRVLVCGSRGGIYIAEFWKVGGYPNWHKVNSKSHYCEPTHWMPLPERP